MRLASPMYSSPESYRMLHGTSSKADIWSLGIMIYEILLVKSERKAQQLNESTENFRLNITLKLLQALAIYSGRSINLNAKLLIPKKFVYDLRWLNSSAEGIKRIFKFWIKSTRLAVLLTNLLHIVPQKRMTAEGVLDYLDLKCYPAEMSWSYAWTGIIFNKITFKKLAEMITEKKRLCVRENCTQKWEQMRKMMDKVRKKRQAIVNESQQMSESVKHCATTYQNVTQNTE
uniref:Protein kinase domain-containing protein n=1 Tax=Globodera rostochiensis TaxID=31243 RepID=A0A914HHA5_GLORO